MTIDRYAVNLFLEIKRNLPQEFAQELKIANPHLSEKMIEIYREIDDDNIKRLIEVLIKRIEPENTKLIRKKRFGFIQNNMANKQLSRKTTRSDDTPVEIKMKQTRNYYRGVLIED